MGTVLLDLWGSPCSKVERRAPRVNRKAHRGAPPARVRSNDGLDAASLKRWLIATANVPDRQDIKRFGCGPVVNEVANATEKQTTNARNPRALARCTDTRLLGKDCQRFANV